MPHEPLIILMEAERSPVETNDTNTSLTMKNLFLKTKTLNLKLPFGFEAFEARESKVAFRLRVGNKNDLLPIAALS